MRHLWKFLGLCVLGMLLALGAAAPALAEAVLAGTPVIPPEAKQGALLLLLQAAGPYAVPILLGLPLLDWGARKAQESGIPVLSQLGWAINWILPLGGDGKVGIPLKPPKTNKRGGLGMFLWPALLIPLALGGCGRYAPCLDTFQGWDHAAHCGESLLPLIRRGCDALPADPGTENAAPEAAPDSETTVPDSDPSTGSGQADHDTTLACRPPGNP